MSISVEVGAQLARLERQLVGTLTLYAKEQHILTSDMHEEIAELFARLSNLENEVAAIVKREEQRHGQA